MTLSTQTTASLPAAETYERFHLDVGDAPLGHVGPGAIARALHAAAGITADSVLWVAPERRGEVVVTLEIAAARAVSTPLCLVVPAAEGARPVVATLRRDTDPFELQQTQFALSWTDGGPPPSLGAIAVALHALPDAALHAESLGVCLPRGDALQLSLSAASMTIADSTTLTVDGRTMTLTRLGR